MKTITKQELKGWQEKGKKYILVDVREHWEHSAYNIGGENVPLNDLMSRKDELDTDIATIIYCEKGIRSAIAIQRLMSYGYNNLYNLTGGMSKWRIEE